MFVLVRESGPNHFLFRSRVEWQFERKNVSGEGYRGNHLIHLLEQLGKLVSRSPAASSNPTASDGGFEIKPGPKIQFFSAPA